MVTVGSDGLIEAANFTSAEMGTSTRVGEGEGGAVVVVVVLVQLVPSFRDMVFRITATKSRTTAIKTERGYEVLPV